MNQNLIFIVSLLMFANVNSRQITNNEGQESIEAQLKKLYEKTISYQVTKARNYTPPIGWEEHFGLFRSEIRLNLVGSPIASDFRRSDISAVFDNDMFSSGWIITSLLEANIYGKGAPLLEAQRLQWALTAIGGCSNKNDGKSSLERTFWPQYYNSTYNIWQQSPINIKNVVLNFVEVVEPLIKIAKELGLDKLVKFLTNIDGIKGFATVFSIPPDFDDTYLNVGIGALLKSVSTIYPYEYNNWIANNTGLESLVNSTVKYSFDPFDESINKNIIDPRTYFYSRFYLNEAKKNNKSVSLITTWIQNIEEQRIYYNKLISMPFNINNVDITVEANSIFGITAGSIYNIDNLATYLAERGDIFVC
jgi:hypothetical protein